MTYIDGGAAGAPINPGRRTNQSSTPNPTTMAMLPLAPPSMPYAPPVSHAGPAANPSTGPSVSNPLTLKP